MSQAGGSGLVIFRQSKHKEAAWRLVEFLSQPARQVRFYELTGNLPPRESAWKLGRLEEDPPVRAFHEQLEHVCRCRACQNGSRSRRRSWRPGKRSIAGEKTVDEAVVDLDRQVDQNARQAPLDAGTQTRNADRKLSTSSCEHSRQC